MTIFKSFSLKHTLPALALLALFTTSCVKGDRNLNMPPETKISIDSINLSGENRLNSSVSLSWFGTDQDGFVEYYEVSVDGENWRETTNQDSTILFDIPAGQDTANADFYVRAYDNDGNVDESPAYLSIPLQNTPPVANINGETAPYDTAFMVSTFAWTATDNDGDESISRVEVRFNNGSWYEINRGQKLLSFLVDTAIQNGAATADLYYGTQDNASISGLDGLEVKGTNYFQIRAFDVAGAVSKVDTAPEYFLRNKMPGTDMLWVSGYNQSISSQYANMLDSIGANYDVINYGPDRPEESLPSYWDPTFKLITRQYPKLFVTSDRRAYSNPATLRTNSLVGFMAPVIQEYFDNGGKSFFSTSFGLNTDADALIGPYPISGIEGNNQGRARIFSDSSLVPTTSVYPEIVSNSVQTGIIPVIESSDSEVLYRAELNNGLSPWTDSDVVGIARRPQNVLRQVFFAVELYKYNQTDVIQLLEEILINEF